MATSSGHERRTEMLARAIERARLGPGEPHPCPYLPGRTARNLIVLPSPLGPGVYHSLMDLNFRRLGPVFYRPECDGCSACRAIRVCAWSFRPNRAQRRAAARNRDLTVAIGRPQPTGEKHALYRRYLAVRHDGQMSGSKQEFEDFLYRSPLATFELEYRLGERLLAVGIADLEPSALSAVYCYYEPDEAARSLGVFNVLRLLAECRGRGIAYLYLGFYVGGCAKMSYKAGFRPCEVLDEEGRWRSV